MQETRDEAEGVKPSEAEVDGEAKASPAAAETPDYKDRWLRAEAELQNFKRRARREIEEARRGAEEAVLLDLVSWLDDLERALESAGETGAGSAWAAGVALVLQKGRAYLERQGV